MKISNLSIGQILLEGTNECTIIALTSTTFEVQYISGACFTFNQSNLDNNEFKTYIF